MAGSRPYQTSICLVISTPDPSLRFHPGPTNALDNVIAMNPKILEEMGTLAFDPPSNGLHVQNAGVPRMQISVVEDHRP